MRDLPRDRVVINRPFEKIGLDFAGPVITKPNLKRSRVTLTSYIAVFICFSTNAIHLEVVSDMSNEAFLACLRRFIARRSKLSIVWCDNATNFKGTKNVLDELFRICRSDPIQSFSSEEGMTWRFIPPSSTEFGGLWEANIKSIKRILTKVAKTTIFNFEELYTLITQIEACLNSRPLSPISADPTDLQPLTPGHFLIGAPLLSIPEPNDSVDSLTFSSRWTLIQNFRAHFWNRWSVEYLNHLQNRSKWNQVKSNLKAEQLVLLKDKNKILMKWTLARIEEIFSGPDGLVRVVDVTTSDGIFRRVVSNISPLPFPNNVGQLSNGGRDIPV
ncbi:uncharacterized protein LOC118200516 [Stegodyphus dumicola]|uniref:uncharacterized protein LOC118200516 n=1 Tax=Stegodyphus dumicola TaxID=202533 RepID=UPI0015B14BE5|nr:uncharacterized protein LOC118200516 [Stegodyphus dumicola]